MNKPEAYALAEVVGAANAVRVVDQMVKTATVTLLAEETTCGGHVTIILSGSVSACQAAVDSVREYPPCEMVGACVISGPSDEWNRLVGELAARYAK